MSIHLNENNWIGYDLSAKQLVNLIKPGCGKTVTKFRD